MKFFLGSAILLAGINANVLPHQHNDDGICFGEMCLTFTNSAFAVKEDPIGPYDGPGVILNPANEQHYSMISRKYIWTDQNDPAVVKLRVHFYGEFMFVSSTEEVYMNWHSNTNDVGDCVQRLYGDKVFNMMYTLFKCGDMQWDAAFPCTHYNNGWEQRPASGNPQLQNWLSINYHNDGEMIPVFTTKCAAGIDEYHCQYDSDYYTMNWVFNPYNNQNPVC